MSTGCGHDGQLPPDTNVNLTSPPAIQRKMSYYKDVPNAWELPKQWSRGTTVYTIGGNTILPQANAKELGEWVSKNYPNWTVVVSEPGWPQAFQAAQDKSRELFHSQSFGEIVDAKTNLPSGNVLLINYKAGRQGGGATTWFSSPLMNRYNLSSGDTWNQRFAQFGSSAANHKNVSLVVKLTIPQIESALQKNIADEAAARARGENIKTGAGVAAGLGVFGIAAYALARRRNANLQREEQVKNKNQDTIDRITEIIDSYLSIDRRKDELGITDPQFVSNLSYGTFVFEFLTSIKDEASREFGTGKTVDAEKTLTTERIRMSDAFATEYQLRNGVSYTAITLEEAFDEWGKVEVELKKTLERADPNATYETSQQAEEHQNNATT